MSLSPSNDILEDEIFKPRDIDPDSETIGRLLERFGEKIILLAMEDVEYSIAVGYYLQLLDSLCAHFVTDEHGICFRILIQVLKLKTITLHHEADKKKYDAKFKAKVAIEALKEHETLDKVAARYELSPVMISC